MILASTSSFADFMKCSISQSPSSLLFDPTVHMICGTVVLYLYISYLSCWKFSFIFEENTSSFEIFFIVYRFDSVIRLNKIFSADVLLIYLHESTSWVGILAVSSPNTDRKEMLTPTLLYNFPFSCEYWPSMNVTNGRLTTIFRYLTLCTSIPLIA